MTEKFNYIEEANVTMSENFHKGVPALLVVSGLMEISGSIDSLDKVKKYMFYGREDQGLSMACAMGKQLHPNDSHDVDFEALVPGKSREEAIRIFHGIIGIITEAGELARALGEALAENKALDLVNVKEEIGDGFWYDAAILRVMGITFEDVQKVNIAKLRARFPNKFDAHDANNRNLERERGILEGKPIGDLFSEHERELAAKAQAGVAVVQLEAKADGSAPFNPMEKQRANLDNWMIIGNIAIGDISGHPSLGAGKGARTSRLILSKPIYEYREGDELETQNTIYILGKPDRA